MTKRVFIISQEEPFYIPKVINYILDNQGEEYEVVGACRLKPHRKNKTMKDWLLERAKIYTYWELFIVFHFFIYAKIWCKLIGKIGVNNPYSAISSYKKHNVTEVNTSDLNSPDFISELSKLNIDVIVSISPPQVFGKKLLDVPNDVCLNAHGTLLPRHRGVFGSWWMLYEDDEEIGATVHTMVEKLDAGDIVFQEAVPMPNKPTQYLIAYTTKKLLAKGVVNSLKTISEKSLPIVTPKYKESYHRAPTKELGKAFHNQGKRVIKWRDGKYALAKSF